MLESKEIVSIVFKLINFAALIWLAKYVFQNYLFPDLKEKLTKKFALFRGLEEKNKELILQNELLEKEIKDQDKLFELLTQKMQTWDQELKKQKEKDLLEAQKISSSHTVRIETQAHNIHSQKILSEIFPRVISGTFRQLEQKFRQEQEADKYFKNIMNFMQNSTINNKQKLGTTK